MLEILTPRLNSNDESLLLTEWLVDEAAQVQRGQVVALVETSKAAADIEAEAEGVIELAAASQAWVAPGEVIARIHPDRDAYERALAGPETSAALDDTDDEPGDGPVLTDAARELVRRHGITSESLRSLGLRLVRTGDLARLISAGAERKPRHQEEVARAVSRSHAEIPDAGATMKVDATALAAAIATAGESARIGMAELMIKALASTRDRFPAFFAQIADGTAGPAPAGAHIAVTVDTGSGLYLPVVRAADTTAVTEIARQLLDYAVKAARRDFDLADFAGANFALSLHLEPGIVHATPVIPYGLVAIASLCGPTNELALDESGGVYARDVVYLGLTYDHRFVNGRDAMRLLADVRAVLESPAHLAALLEPSDPDGEK